VTQLRTYLPQLVALASRGQALRDAHLSYPQLLAGPHRGARRPARASRGLRVLAADKGKRAVVRLYGPIGKSWWDDTAVSASQFAEMLDGIGADGIDLHINSGGGDAFDAVAMHAELLNHPSDVVTYVNGIAASAASMIAMAGDEIVIEKPARFMIHDAASLAYGPPAVMQEMHDILDEISDSIAQMYADRAGGTMSSWREAMKAETWYPSARAVEVGLADRVANDRAAQQDDDEDEDEPMHDPSEMPEDRRTQLIRARARTAIALGRA
jgi:ATP-dependent protease ClpP protease subunit